MKKKVYVHIRINEDLQKELKKEAMEKGISFNAYVNLIFSERVK